MAGNERSWATAWMNTLLHIWGDNHKGWQGNQQYAATSILCTSQGWLQIIILI